MNIILQYFDEESQTNCGQCDYCLKQKNRGLDKETMLVEKILKVLERSKGLDSTALAENLSGYDESDIDNICRKLCAKEILIVDSSVYRIKNA